MLAPFTANPELSSLVAGIARDRAQGRVFYGDPILRPQLTTLSVERRIAVISDCQDASRTGDKSVATGRLLTVGTSRTLVVSTMHLLSDGKWRVVFVTFPQRKC